MTKKRSVLPFFVLFLICLLSFSLMLWVAFGDSAITDELAHIPSGYGYVHNLDYRLNPEHPPLVKALAAFPLLFLNPQFPTNSNAWQKEINGEWDMGAKFLYGSGNDANLIIRIARIFPILLTILTVVLIYFWSKEILGGWWALLPAFLFALSPSVLAHGHYVTTDIAASFGTLLGTYFFLKFLLSPSSKNLVIAGLALGLAELAKFSVVLLIPYFLIIYLFFYFHEIVRSWSETAEKFRKFGKLAWKYLVDLILIFFIGYAFVVYPVYYLFTLRYPIEKQVADTEFILASYGGGPTLPGKTCHLQRCPADLDILLAKNQLTRPLAQYMLGVLMDFQRVSGGNTDYFLGEVSAIGSPLYFPALYLLKEPLPTLILVFWALLLSLWASLKAIKRYKTKFLKYFFSDYLALNFTEFSMLAFVILYWAYAIHSPLNIGFRHLFPTIPLIYILSATVWKNWVSGTMPEWKLRITTIWKIVRTGVTRLFKSVLLAILLIWFLSETISAAPYFLSYFNEIGGGIWNGYHYVTDSNYDWGQDLLRLQQFVEGHPEIDKIAVDYFGGGSPQYYLGAKEIDWQSAKGNPADQGIHWLAVSINTLEGATQKLAPGQTRNAQDEYGWLTAIRLPAPGMGNVPQPDFRIGTSIFVYHL